MKNKKNKGFTLVELIVVLVILAILAAILVPALLGYIDRAREKQYVLNAKSALTATQAELSSIYGEDSNTPATLLSNRAATVRDTADVPGTFYILSKLDDGSATEATSTPAKKSSHDAYTVTKAIYVENGYYLFFDGKSWQSFQSEEDCLKAAGNATLSGVVGTVSTNYIKVFEPAATN